jgi:hypothetical protein
VKTLEAVELQLGIHDASGTQAHAAGTDRMMMSHHRAL